MLPVRHPGPLTAVKQPASPAPETAPGGHPGGPAAAPLTPPANLLQSVGVSRRPRSLKITVKLFASLSEYLPAGAERNQIDLEFPEGTTPGDIITQLNVPPEMAHLVILDGVFVPPSERASLVLEAGQEIAFFPPVAGG